MKRAKWGCLIAIVLLIMAPAVQAAKFLQLSLTPTVQIVDQADSVAGLRLSIYGENANMSGVDIGLVNQTTGNFKGVGLDILSMVDGNVSGVDLGLINQTAGNFKGISLSLISLVEGNASGFLWQPYGYGRVGGDFVGWHGATFFSYLKGNSQGLETSLVSRNMGDFTGWQLGLIYAEAGGHMKGLQTGIFNMATSASGLQLGLVNMTDDMYGLQIGLVNIIETGRFFFFPIVNGKF